MELGTAIALFEYDSIAAGIESGDDMVKRAPLQVIHAGTVHPGKYLVLVSGSVGDVEEALAAAELRNTEHLLAEMFLPDPHPALIGGLAGDEASRTGESLGIIETDTVADVIRAADAGLKGADVVMLKLHLADDLGGRGYVLFSGPLTEVDAAVEQGSARVEGILIERRVIPRLHDEMADNIGGDGRFASRIER
jgi:microcompartment protein CcmL/EutN